MALPWLPSLQGAHAAHGGVATNVVFYYWPMGAIPEQFAPTAAGTQWDATGVLEPMARHRGGLTVISGMSNVDDPDYEGDAHAMAAASVLTGEPMALPDHVSPGSGRSVDQHLADLMRGRSRYASLEIASQADHPCLPNENCSYREHISWNGVDQPRTRATSPLLLFERLFGGDTADGDAAGRARRLVERRSVLDVVLGSAKRVQAAVGAEDRLQLDAYFTSVREIEKRLTQPPLSAACLLDGAITTERLHPEFMRTQELVDLMQELAVLALHCGQTHVITYMVANEGSVRAYPELGVPDEHHFVTHYGRSETRKADAMTVTAWMASTYATFLDRLAALPGVHGGTLLDETLVVGFGSMGDPDQHTHTDLPVVLAGGGGHRGEHLRLTSRPFADLLLTILRRQGGSQHHFGRDGTTPLSIWG